MPSGHQLEVRWGKLPCGRPVEDQLHCVQVLLKPQNCVAILAILAIAILVEGGLTGTTTGGSAAPAVGLLEWAIGRAPAAVNSSKGSRLGLSQGLILTLWLGWLGLWVCGC